MIKPKILYLFPNTRTQITKYFLHGKGPDTLLYGSNHLKKSFQTELLSPSNRKNILYYLFLPLEEITYRLHKVHFQIYRLLPILKMINKFEIILVFGEALALPLLLLKKVFPLKPKIIYFSFDFAFRFKEKKGIMFWFYKFLAEEADHIVCFANIEVKIFRQVFKIPKNQISFIAPGVDIGYYRGRRNPSVLISVGNGTRDFDTLFKAAKWIKGKIILVARKDKLKGLKIPKNIDVIYELKPEALKKLYKNAMISIIPLPQDYKATGQLVLLDSLASGIPTIISKTLGITTAFKFRGGKDLIFTEPGNPNMLASRIRKVTNNGGMRKELSISGSNVVKKYSSKIYASNLKSLIEKVYRS